MQRNTRHTEEAKRKISLNRRGKGTGKTGPWSEERIREWKKRRWPQYCTEQSND
jgi:hypothetical protein